MVGAPADNDEEVIAAVPLLTVTGEPRLVTPSLNCTVPVGVPEPGGTAETVAVKVTAWPKVDGLLFEVTAVALPARLTFWLSAGLVLPAKLLSPLYTAVMPCAPTDNDDAEDEAVPPLL